ncbi:heavy metal sensor histidine kinase [Aromatoleum evansii]|uniref:Sensor protein n=1 Tax=Aromatoleum evansii TaxID=59406 RepID=A0ABZ1AVG2_AROEV|nr:heavy metal sensor histidine kinase [Aromatoleum toluclasticum]MBD5802740.1 Sensor protein CzcS precursor [Azoarcus sp. Aa7]WRL48656.1 heavy metal sensor histidine kinase [Aromatoleum evansii]
MRNSRSLGRWLSWWLAVQTFIGLGFVCAVVYVATSLNFSARQAEELRHKQDVIRHLVREIATPEDLPSLRHKLDDFFIGHADLKLRLTADAETLLYMTPPAPEPPANLRRVKFEIPSPWSGAVVLRAELALDSSSDAQLLRQLAWTLLASALAGAVLVSGGGAWLVRRALLPVRDLARQAAALSPENVGQPLDGSAQAQELQPLVAQFNALLVRLDNAYRQLEGFNADVAHELRTPLATLIGETELVLSRERGIPELRDVLGSNLEDLHRLAGLVNDMLFLSKADRGERARRQPVGRLAGVAAEVVEFHDAALQEAGVSVRVRGDSSGAFDAPLLRRALSNLLANATRFAERGSVIDVAIEPGTAGAVRLSVSNVGPVIPAQDLPRLFDRFYRADLAREHGDFNHGLGLSIVAAIARMHGGNTFAQSSAGRTTIGFSLSGESG